MRKISRSQIKQIKDGEITYGLKLRDYESNDPDGFFCIYAGDPSEFNFVRCNDIVVIELGAFKYDAVVLNSARWGFTSHRNPQPDYEVEIKLLHAHEAEIPPITFMDLLADFCLGFIGAGIGMLIVSIVCKDEK